MIYTGAYLSELEPLLIHGRLGVVGWDRELRIAYWPQSAERIFQIPQNAVLEKSVEDAPFVHVADRIGVIERSSRLRSGTQVERVNINRNLRGDGSMMVCRWTRAIEQDDDHIHVISLVEDITHEYAARDSILESEARFRSLYSNNPDMIVTLDRDGYVVDVNDEARNNNLFTFSDALGQHYRNLVPDGEIDRHSEYFEKARTGITQEYEVRLPDVYGAQRDLLLKTIPIMERGSFNGVFTILHDDSERREQERAVERKEQERFESSRRLRSLFEANPDGVIGIDLSGRITEANAAMLRLTGLRSDELIGTFLVQLLPEDQHEIARTHFVRASSGDGCSVALKEFRADRSILSLDVTFVPQFANDLVTGIYAIAQDVSLRIEAQERAKLQAQRVRDLYSIASTGDEAEERIVEALMLGCRVFDADVGVVINTLSTPPHVESIACVHETAYDEDRIITLAGQIARESTSTSPLLMPEHLAVPLDVSGERFGTLIFSSDATRRNFTETDAEFLGLLATLISGSIERKRSRLHLQSMAYVDSLTELPNRVAFHERLRDAISSAPLRLERLAVLFFDLDRFKDINETLGHALGDRLLQLVAQRLLDHFATVGTIARMGGDEFAILVTQVTSADALRDLAERIMQKLEEPYAIDEFEQFISASIGIAIFPEDGRDDQTLVKNADIAMYRAKDRGRNNLYFYNASLESPIQMRLSQEKLLRRALERNEFLVYYQPQFDLLSSEVVGVEALVRWLHPQSGMIEPRHFIPSAEISGLIVPLGKWVLETATTQMSIWVKKYGDIRLAVNLSARQLHQRRLREEILGIVDSSGLRRDLLELEITESVAMSDAELSIKIIRELKASGIRTAVDDFGTGYSSLSYLRRFQFDVLKIDGSFVAGIGRQPEDETIVKTLVGMAHSLGLETIAECVEREEQLAFLRDYGCKFAQGHIFARALPPESCEEFFLRRTERALS